MTMTSVFSLWISESGRKHRRMWPICQDRVHVTQSLTKFFVLQEVEKATIKVRENEKNLQLTTTFFCCFTFFYLRFSHTLFLCFWMSHIFSFSLCPFILSFSVPNEQQKNCCPFERLWPWMFSEAFFKVIAQGFKPFLLSFMFFYTLQNTWKRTWKKCVFHDRDPQTWTRWAKTEKIILKKWQIQVWEKNKSQQRQKKQTKNTKTLFWSHFDEF